MENVSIAIGKLTEMSAELDAKLNTLDVEVEEKVAAYRGELEAAAADAKKDMTLELKAIHNVIARLSKELPPASDNIETSESVTTEVEAEPCVICNTADDVVSPVPDNPIQEE